MQDKIVHIGFPKTGTTFLQKNVYPFLEGVDYHDYKIADELFYDIIFLDDLDYDPEKNAENFKKYLISDSTSLFSFESLAGAPFIYKGVNRSRIPERLKEMGFNKIIISVRNQTEMIDSLYRQYVVQGGVMKFKDFLDLDEKWKLSIRPFYLGYLDYSGLVRKYIEVFGAENVLVIKQESLRNTKQELIEDVSQFVGAKGYKAPERVKSPNESLTNLSINLLRLCNHFIFTSQKPNNLIWNRINTWFVRRVFVLILDPYFFRFLSSKKSFLNAEQKQVISTFYQESNAQLKSLVNIEMK